MNADRRAVLSSIQATINILLHRQVRIDPVTKAISLLLRVLTVEIDVPFWSQHVAFVLVSIMILTSLRSFLQHVMRVRRMLLQLLLLLHHRRVADGIRIVSCSCSASIRAVDTTTKS